MGRGLLAGAKLNGSYEQGDIRAGMPRFVEPNLSHNLKTIEKFEQFAAELGLTAAQLSLAWTLSRGTHVVPIPGMTSLAHLLENLAAASVTLDAGSLGILHALFAGDSIRGPRYSAEAQAQVDTELLPDECLAS
jgi:aryl-alcohol dehydrogenase-like predicted oxidoreductase